VNQNAMAVTGTCHIEPEQPRSETSIKAAPSHGSKRAKRGSVRKDDHQPVRPWQELVDGVRIALANLPHPEARDRVLEQLRKRGFTLPDCLNHPGAREALAESITAVEDGLENDPHRAKWPDRVQLRDVRRTLEWKLWP
jgi:hypothetical protein